MDTHPNDGIYTGCLGAHSFDASGVGGKGYLSLEVNIWGYNTLIRIIKCSSTVQKAVMVYITICWQSI